MDTLKTDQIFATLKVEKVNDFEFLKGVKPHSSNLLGLRDDFRAKVSIKVGNSVMNTHLEYCESYIPSHYDKDGKYVYSTNGPIGARVHSMEGLDTLTAAGIEIDTKDIIESYMVEVNMYIIQLEVLKDEAKKASKLKIETDYDNSWIHGYGRDCENVKKFAKLTHEVEFNVIEKDEVLNKGCQHQVSVSYRGYKTNIFIDYGYNGINSYTYGNISSNTNKYYDFGKPKKSANSTHLFFKFIELINYELAVAKSKYEREDKESKEREIVRTHLEEITGEKVNIHKESKSQNDHRGQYMRPYDVYYNRIQLKGVEYTISTHTPRVYNDGEYTYLPEVFSIKGIQNITGEQLKAIIKILK